MTADVVHVPEQSRFQIGTGDEPAVLVYELGDGNVGLLHTVVPRALER
jgi:hypothetical protein